MITTLKIHAKFEISTAGPWPTEDRALLIYIDDDYTCQTRLKSMGDDFLPHIFTSHACKLCIHPLPAGYRFLSSKSAQEKANMLRIIRALCELHARAIQKEDESVR